jgi:hypothetical protein
VHVQSATSAGADRRGQPCGYSRSIEIVAQASPTILECVARRERDVTRRCRGMRARATRSVFTSNRFDPIACGASESASLTPFFDDLGARNRSSLEFAGNVRLNRFIAQQGGAIEQFRW